MKTTAFTLYNASAGSGKTYTLTKEYLKIILLANQNDAYKKILAITFTNKAVEEMKNRVIDSLFEFSKEKTSEKKMDLIKDLSAETGLSMVTIKDKSKAIIQSIIHNYSAFGISTIDKFTHKVIRSFAQDLDLPSNFEVVLDTDALLQEAVDLIISKVGDDEQLTKHLVDFAKNKTDDDKNWDVSSELFEISKLLINENYAEEISLFQDKTFSDFKKIKEVIRQKIEELQQNSIALATETYQLIEDNINPKSFYSSYVPNFLAKVKLGNIAGNTTVIKYLDGEKGSYSTKTPENDKIWIDNNADKILQVINSINYNVGKIAFYTAFAQNLNALSLLNVIHQEFKNLQKEQNILSISDFNTIIYNEIKNQPALYIYERFGEKYRHFFIDEFQDTSIMQWNNLIPLIDNALASEENNIQGSLLIVGDPKQSIYRWRGGKAEQFIDLSKEGINPFTIKDKEVKNLDTNYRSFSEIIEFNNDFFKFLSGKFLNEDYKDLYQNHSFQKSNSKKGGYVNISFIENEEDEGFNAEESDYSYKNLQYLEKTLRTIHQVKANGFSYNEMVVLTRKTKEGILLANYLTENNIPILSSETLLIQNATEVKLIIALLRYLNNNKDAESKAFVLYYVGRYCQNQLPVHNFIAKNKNVSETEFETELEQNGIKISFKNCRRKTLYEALELMVHAFLSEKANSSYVQYFLDLVLEKDSKTQSGIAEFLDYWDKTGFKKSIPSPEGLNAVRIMTIHKSKGLEFPVVIYPFAEENFSRSIQDKIWLDFEKDDDVDFPKALVNSKNEVTSYGEKAKFIFEEKQQEKLLDIINILYVTLTRAEEQLYIISNLIKTKKGTLVENNLAYYFIEFLQNLNLFEETKLNYEFGTNNRISTKEDKNLFTEAIKPIKEKLPFENIKIAKKEALLWNTHQEEAISYGTVLHEIMALITYKNTLDDAVLNAIETGLITQKESEIIKRKILQIVEDENLKDFFIDEGIVYNEKVIIDKTYGNIKPDRVVIKNNEAYLLDYKTGAQLPSHIKQINQYAEALSKMNKNVVKKALVYIGEKIETVLL